ncbi:MAG: hypothetical protein AB202_00240 [Parcubacteria bacterium C7867-007]|nr:MAG: hypothetical protein AB202_00240 [Parcubacteria bacterium C7867-007]
MKNSLRTKEMVQSIRDYNAEHPEEKNGECALCTKEAVETFSHWKITENKFPYDLVATTHHMIMPLRHATETELTMDEWKEYQEIKHSKLQEYDYLLEGTSKTKSIPAHFHIHLIIGKGPQ